MRTFPRNQPKLARKRLRLPLILIFLIIAMLTYKKIDLENWRLNLFSWWRGEIVSPIPNELSQEGILQQKLQEQGLSVSGWHSDQKEAQGEINGAWATFDLKKDLNEQVVSLQLILRQAKIEGKQPKKIDLRFSKPVILY